MLDASNLGRKIKLGGKNQKTVLSADEEQQIISTFNNKEQIDDLSVTVSYGDIKEKNYNFSAGQYFEVKMEYVDITAEQFTEKMQNFTDSLDNLFKQSHKLESEIELQLARLNYE